MFVFLAFVLKETSFARGGDRELVDFSFFDVFGFLVDLFGDLEKKFISRFLISGVQDCSRW